MSAVDAHVTFTAQSSQVAGMLGDLALTAAKGSEIPLFTVVRVHLRGERFYGWSSDRYRIAQARAEVVWDGDAPTVPTFHLSREDCLAVAKTSRSWKGHVTVTVTFAAEDVASLTVSDGGSSITVNAVNVDGPEFRVSSVAPADLPESSGPAKFQAAYLADLATVGKRRKDSVAIATAEGDRAAHFQIGPDYRAWIMPVRGSVEWLTPEW